MRQGIFRVSGAGIAVARSPALANIRRHDVAIQQSLGAEDGTAADVLGPVVLGSMCFAPAASRSSAAATLMSRWIASSLSLQRQSMCSAGWPPVMPR